MYRFYELEKTRDNSYAKRIFEAGTSKNVIFKFFANSSL